MDDARLEVIEWRMAGEITDEEERELMAYVEEGLSAQAALRRLVEEAAEDEADEEDR